MVINPHYIPLRNINGIHWPSCFTDEETDQRKAWLAATRLSDFPASLPVSKTHHEQKKCDRHLYNLYSQPQLKNLQTAYHGLQQGPPLSSPAHLSDFVTFSSPPFHHSAQPHNLPFHSSDRPTLSLPLGLL